MKKFVFSSFVDGALTLSFSFVAAYTVLLSVKTYIPSAIMIAAVVAVFSGVGVYLLSSKVRLARIDGDESGAIYACMNTFNVCAPDENARYFCSVFSDMHISATVADGHITLSDGTILIPAFTPSPLNDNQLAIILRDARNKKPKSILVLSSAFDVGAVRYAKKTGVLLVSAKDIYAFLKERSRLPETPAPQKKTSLKEFFARLFVKRNGVRFILFGLSLVIMAFVTFYPIYYYVAGAGFILFGIAALFFAAAPTVESGKPLSELLAEF